MQFRIRSGLFGVDRLKLSPRIYRHIGFIYNYIPMEIEIRRVASPRLHYHLAGINRAEMIFLLGPEIRIWEYPISGHGL